ncbi:hypothetical protein P5673_000587 [Acropora cervicornis]|uniref:Uncharacterized protein n=1 Tax=Acropora cervicornis TaxID=6130 RepID=A0AAD9R7C8_ACRCE|nr:hypothetical protein P5673_000587 [Acropora cervicornis]
MTLYVRMTLSLPHKSQVLPPNDPTLNPLRSQVLPPGDRNPAKVLFHLFIYTVLAEV